MSPFGDDARLQLDHGVVRPLQLDDRATVAHRFEHAFSTQPVGEHHCRRVTNGARSKTARGSSVVIVAAAERCYVGSRVAEHVPELDGFRTEDEAPLFPAASANLQSVDLIGSELMAPAAADAQVSHVEARMHQREQTLRPRLLREVLNGQAIKACLVVHPVGSPNRVGMPLVGRDLDARHEQEVRKARLNVPEEVLRSVRVVVGDLDEVEALSTRKLGDLIQARGRIAALA